MKNYKIIKEDKGLKVSDYLRERHGYSGRGMRKIDVYLNGKKIKPSSKIKTTGTMKVDEKEKQTNIEPIKMDLDIVYEDNDLLIVNKPPYLLTHPTKKKVDKTLANGIVNYFMEKENKNIVPRFYNRLDMNTSGLIIVAKNSFSQAYLQNHGEIEKKYLAIVENVFEDDMVGKEIVIEKPIYQEVEKLERIIDERGQYAKTVVKVLEVNKEKNISLIECELFTGRTHQIRVHLKSIGHTILGDELYSSNVKKIERQLLHSYKLKLNQPSTKEEIKLEIPLYEDMEKYLKNKM